VLNEALPTKEIPAWFWPTCGASLFHPYDSFAITLAIPYPKLEQSSGQGFKFNYSQNIIK
jgi:hypothetical protein